MASFGVYFASVSVPIAKRVLAGLGIGVVTYVGLAAVMTQIQNSVISNWGVINISAMQFLSLAGVPDAIGIVLGAVAARFSMLQLSALGRIQ